MADLPVVSGVEVVRALERCGYAVRRRPGSHVVLKHAATGRTVSVPIHGVQDVPRGTLRRIIRDAGLTVAEFIELLR